MSVTLSKGQRVDLNKDKQLNKVLVALGWDSNKYDGEADFDLDASVFLVKYNNKVGTDQDFIFYGNLEHPTKCIVHTGDDRTGANDGDDEIIKVELNKNIITNKNKKDNLVNTIEFKLSINEIAIED